MVVNLVDAFKSINKSSISNPYILLHLKQGKDVEDLIQRVKEWIIPDIENKPEVIVDQLKVLQSSKQSQIEALIDPTVWPTLYLSQPVIQQYLKLVINCSSDNVTIINMLTQIVTLIDVSLVTLSRSDMHYIADSLYHQQASQYPGKLQYREFSYLHCVISQVSKQLKTDIGNLTIKKYLVTRFLEQLFEQYINYMHKTKQNYEVLFLFTLLYPFDYNIKEKTFQQLLDLDDLEYLAYQFSKPVTVYFQICENGDAKIQAFLFYLTVSAVGIGVTDLIQVHINYLKEELNTKVVPQIYCILHATDDWAELKSKMFAVICTKSLIQLLQPNNLSPLLMLHQNTMPKLDSQNVRAPLAADGFKRLLEMLKLTDKYPEKLTKNDAMLLCRSTLENARNTDQLHMLPYLVLQKILMCDSKCRTNLFKNANEIKRSKIYAYENKNSASINTEDNDDDNGSSSSSDSEDEDKYNISPVDIILILLYCSDNLLRQTLLHKLSLCQLAIPCLLPDPFSKSIKYLLWSMRSITKAWRYSSLKSVSCKECHIVDYKMPIITFIRIGHGSKSKSSILNNVISDSKQEFFFTWNSDGGAYNRYMTNGVVDLCWYLPSGSKEDFYHDPITFLNLHGNAPDYPLQLNFIGKVSYMLFVLIGDNKELDHNTIATLQKFSLVAGGVVLMFYSKKTQKHVSRQLKDSTTKLYAFMIKNENDSEIRKEICSIMQKNLQSLSAEHELSLVECAQIADNLLFTVDENDPPCSHGKKLANHIMYEIKSYSTEEAKLKLFPLQSQLLWHEWAKLDKERSRHTMKHNTSIDSYNMSKDKEKLLVRKSQKEISDNLTPAMAMFLSIMINCDDNIKKYFLEWMKLLLDDHSRQTLSSIYSKYQDIQSEIFNFKEDNTHLQELKDEFKKQSKQLSLASFGIEHFFRELSQIYEARMDPMQTDIPTDVKELLSCLPLMAAKLITEGYSMELMDGEASHVPITWISQVLDHLTLIYKGKNIFTISILGIQSSGKSTLLNTMFGLQFNTSPGRCTKGVFFHLLATDSELQSKIECDLVLIIDTEGLHAPEFDGSQAHDHDNELATFVIGLADVTVINIKGETPADLKDILQIAVLAFIRMKSLTIQPSCHFVHQNIDDVTAPDKTKVGRQKFLENLDIITESAAKVEFYDSQIKSFKDVIAFNENTDVHFFPSLLKGNLPIASINPEYSKNAQYLKSRLLQQGSDMQHDKTPVLFCYTFAEFRVRVEHLWNAVLHENYIFSFKNSLEIVAYNELDTALNQWSWKFQCGISEWRYQAENKIYSTKNSESVELECTQCLGDAKVISSRINNKVIQEMQDFFQQNKYKSTIAQWESHTKRRITILHKEFDDEATQFCNDLKTRQLDCFKIQGSLKCQQDKLRILVTDLVTNSRRQSIDFSDFQLNESFELNWNQWKKEFTTVEFTTEDRIYAVAELCLKCIFPAQFVYIKKYLDNCSLRQRRPADFHFDNTKHLVSHGKICKAIPDNDIIEARNATTEFIQVINHKLLAEDCKSFDQAMIFAPLNVLQLQITQFNGNEHKRFAFTPAYIADIALHVSVHIIDRCKIILKQYQQKYDPLILLEEQKPTFLTFFKNQYKQIASDITAAENFCRLLITPIKEQMIKAFPNKIISFMKEKATFQSKQAFKCQILKDLADCNNFEDFITYIENVEESFKQWAEIYIVNHCNEMNKLVEISTQTLKRTCRKINGVIKEMAPTLDLNKFLEEFHKKLNGAIKFMPNDLIHITGIKTLTDYQLFLKEITGRIITIEKDILELLYDPQSELVVELKLACKQSAHLLSNSLQGCKAVCPFCKEQCEMSDPNHVKFEPKFHSLLIHRPVCLARFKTTHNNKLALDLCTTLVGSRERFKSRETNEKFVPYKKYQNIYPDWHIPHDSREVPKYWRWFIATHNNQLGSKFEANPADIKSDWISVEKDEAVRSLQETYNLA